LAPRESEDPVGLSPRDKVGIIGTVVRGNAPGWRRKTSKKPLKRNGEGKRRTLETLEGPVGTHS